MHLTNDEFYDEMVVLWFLFYCYSIDDPSLICVQNQKDKELNMRGTFFDSPSILPKKVKNRKISYFIFLFFYLFTNGNHSVHRKSTILNTIMIGQIIQQLDVLENLLEKSNSSLEEKRNQYNDLLMENNQCMLIPLSFILR